MIKQHARKIKADIPVDTRSEANTREHYMLKARRVKNQRKYTYNYLRAMFGACIIDEKTKITILLTRVSSRILDDDNLRSALKAVRDGIADWMGIDDGSNRITWNYAQEKQAATLRSPKIRSVKFELTTCQAEWHLISA